MRLSRLVRGASFRKILSEAERLVDYSGSLGLQHLLNDDVASVAIVGRKLLGTRHPLIATAKKIIYCGENAIQTRGLIVLLMSRLANGSLGRDGISEDQRSLAEIAELIYTANLMHRGILDTEDMSADYARLSLGNKMAVLGGDYLLGIASTSLAKLGSPQVTAWIARAIEDMSTEGFLPPPESMESWEGKVYLSSGSLLAHSCKASFELSGHPEAAQDAGFCFGKLAAVCLACVQASESDRGVLETEFPKNHCWKDLSELCEVRGRAALAQLSGFSDPESKQSLTSLLMHVIQETRLS